MSEELCHLALTQTLDLIGLSEEMLRGFCRRRFSTEEVYRHILGKVLGGQGRRGPTAIFIAAQGTDCQCYRGRLFSLRQESLVARSDEVTISLATSFAANLVTVEGGKDAVAVNWGDVSGSLEQFQEFFHPEVVKAIGAPIQNFVSCRISGDVAGVLVALNYPGRATDYDADVLRSAAVVIGTLVTVSNGMRETEEAFVYTVEALARACEAAEPDTGKHIVRLNRYAGALAAYLGQADPFIAEISYSAQMHDVGKIRIPVEILLKRGPLSSQEMKVMRQHPKFGADIIGDAPRLSMAREIALSHHENWDGSGYPKRLKRERIPLSGRIVKLCDVYDALRSRRSYKKPFSHADALTIFREGDDRIDPQGHFDPQILETFFKIEHMFEMIYDSSIQRITLDERRTLTE